MPKTRLDDVSEKALQNVLRQMSSRPSTVNWSSFATGEDVRTADQVKGALQRFRKKKLVDCRAILWRGTSIVDAQAGEEEPDSTGESRAEAATLRRESETLRGWHLEGVLWTSPRYYHDGWTAQRKWEGRPELSGKSLKDVADMGVIACYIGR